MSGHDYTPAEGKGPFRFTPESEALAKTHIAKYPPGRQQSAVMPLLDIAQRQNGGWLTEQAIRYIAEYLGMPEIRVWEVASFYTMYNLQPIGRYHVQVCTTTPCWLRDSGTVVEACKKTLGIEVGETTADGKFTLTEVECLGACACAPAVQIDNACHENMTPEKMAKTLDSLAAKTAGKKAR